jgi:hypothetical protein
MFIAAHRALDHRLMGEELTQTPHNLKPARRCRVAIERSEWEI